MQLPLPLEKVRLDNRLLDWVSISVNNTQVSEVYKYIKEFKLSRTNKKKANS